MIKFAEEDAVELKEIRGEDSFIRHNGDVWEKSTGTWIDGEMSHIRDLKPILIEKIRSIMANSKVDRIVDFGCGEGWCHRAIRHFDTDVEYLGVDMNPKFIDHLNYLYQSDENTSFLNSNYAEIEAPVENSYADIAICSFSLFEIVKFEHAIRNIVFATRNGGKIIVFTIDRIWQLIDISVGLDDLYRKILTAFSGNNFFYDTKIRSEKEMESDSYATITHSVAQYINIFTQSGAKLCDYQENIFNSGKKPICYSMIVFEKLG